MRHDEEQKLIGSNEILPYNDEASEIDDLRRDELSNARPSNANLSVLTNDITVRNRYIRFYLLLPIIFLTVTLLGGLRLSSPHGSFVFIPPALPCLFFSVIMMLLVINGGLVRVKDWFSDEFPLTKTIANSGVLISFFAAATQIFNSLLPEAGLPYWIGVFCFAWILWNNIFADLDNRKLVRSMVALFGFAFAAKYLLLPELTAPASESWLRSLIENPTQEIFTWALSLPRYSKGTGYIQFFTLLLFFFGLMLMPNSTRFSDTSK